MNENMHIGFSQRIQLDWLEQTANLVIAGYAKKEIKAALEELLKEQLSVGNTNPESRGNRGKAISILLKVWVDVPRNVEFLRDDGLHHLKRLPMKEHLAVQWGMTMAVYPFFGSVAEIVGRLLRLQDSIATSQVLRRMREQLGQRSTVERAARRVLRCFVDWGVLEELKEKGVYRAAPVRALNDRALAGWLIEAMLIASGSAAGTVRVIAQSPALFPFKVVPLNSRELESSGRLDLFRQGLDEDVVMLRGR